MTGRSRHLVGRDARHKTMVRHRMLKGNPYLSDSSVGGAE